VRSTPFVPRRADEPRCFVRPREGTTLRSGADGSSDGVKERREKLAEAREDLVPKRSNAYQIFIFVLTILSLVIMVGLVIPRVSQATKDLLNWYDNLICVVFLLDFASNMRKTTSKKRYLIQGRGWLDLLGSIPSFGFVVNGQYASLFRLARLSRLSRITRLLRRQNKSDVVDDIVHHRGQYAAVITALMAVTVLVFASVFVLQFESRSPDANITSGGDAPWWSIVTITTVGYGNFFPVTSGGRITAVFVMLMGIGIIGALASILASYLVPTGNDEDDAETASLERHLSDIKGELAAVRRALEHRGPPP
jgi:voltage-gated potassium channel